jgi:hypothetical protein
VDRNDLRAGGESNASIAGLVPSQDYEALSTTPATSSSLHFMERSTFDLARRWRRFIREESSAVQLENAASMARGREKRAQHMAEVMQVETTCTSSATPYNSLEILRPAPCPDAGISTLNLCVGVCGLCVCGP